MRTPKLRRNGDGRAFAVYPNSDGRRKYFGTFGTPQATRAYKAWLSDVIASMATNEPPAEDRKAGKSIGELGSLYIDFAERYYRGSRERDNVLDTMRLLLDHSGSLAGDRFGPNALRAFQSHLASQQKNGRSRFARTTINAHVNRVRRFIRWCQSRELVRPGIVAELETVDGLRKGRTSVREPRIIEPVPVCVWRATLPFLPETVRHMTTVQFWCGMRPGEVCGLLPSEVDRSGEVWIHRPSKHKNAHRDRPLIKAIPPVVQPVLAPYLVGPRDEPAFLNQDGNPYSADSYGSAVRRGVRAAMKAHVPIPLWHPNQLRHSILTEIRNRLGLEDAQKWAGHSRSSTTLIYSWTATDSLTRIAAAIGTRAG